MGAPKQKWTAEEEAALKAGISKHGTGKWRTILKDPEFSNILRYRSNVDLKVPFLSFRFTPPAAVAVSGRQLRCLMRPLVMMNSFTGWDRRTSGET